jgi:hypothetical protein
MDKVKIIKKPIARFELKNIAKELFGDLVKAAVDIEKGIMAVGGELHSDEEILLIEKEGAKPEFIWGINLYPEKQGKAFIEFDSMINLKPAFNNRSRGVDDPVIRERIIQVVSKLIKS